MTILRWYYPFVRHVVLCQNECTCRQTFPACHMAFFQFLPNRRYKISDSKRPSTEALNAGAVSFFFDRNRRISWKRYEIGIIVTTGSTRSIRVTIDDRKWPWRVEREGESFRRIVARILVPVWPKVIKFDTLTHGERHVSRGSATPFPRDCAPILGTFIDFTYTNT